MFIVLGLLYALIFCFIFYKPLKKHPSIFYAAAIGIDAFLLAYSHFNLYSVLPEWVFNYGIGLFYRGAFSTSLFTIVMYTGALNKKLPFVKKALGIRGELSIIACLLTLGHNILYGIYYFPKLLTNPGELKLFTLLATCITIILLLLMLPLMITSFYCVRKKMKAKTWKNLQRLAYPFYGLIYVHIMLLYIPNLSKKGINGWVTVGIYTVIFILYAVLRIRNYRIGKQLSTAPKHPLAKAV